jgi:DNA-binding transcriptional LysR family regulator
MTRLRVFREVARHRSFSAAAAALNYTQSSVSQQVTNLERELRTTLFDRTSRPVELTPAGEIVLRHAEELLGRAAAIQRELDAIGAGEAGTLRLGGFYTAWTSFLPRAVASYSRAHPQVHLDLRQLEPEPALRALRAGELDLAVTYRYEPVADELERIELFDDPFVVALPAAHRLAGRRSVRFADLARERWVSPPPDTPHTRLLVRLCREQGFEPDVAFETIDVATAQPLVAADLAISVLPLLAASPVLDGVVIRPLAGKTPARTLDVVRVPGRQIPVVPAMVDAIRDAA